jgi:preprotein translocase subunit SecA
MKMAMQFLSKLFGTKNSRELKRMNRVMMLVNEFEPQIEALSD